MSEDRRQKSEGRGQILEGGMGNYLNAEVGMRNAEKKERQRAWGRR
jgi:hypothetical protein